MKITLNGDIEVINREVKESNNTVAIWGAGACAASFLCDCGYHERFDYFIDGNEKKWNTEFAGKMIFGTDRILNDNHEDMIIIIATMYFKSVIDSLKQMGYRGKVFSAFHVHYRMGQGASEGLAQNIDKLKTILADEKSMSLVDTILEKRQALDIDYSDINEPHQYFVKGITERNPHAVFVDGGAFLGETVDEFIEFQQNEFEKVYSFEMDEANYRRIDTSKYDERVEFLNYGLWSEETECRYDSDATSSALGDSGELVAKCMPIDKVCAQDKVTLIKMDIEGAEEEALRGAYRTITENKPQLAICIYHKPNDIYEIPFLLKEWVPEYRFYIRHHSDNFTETVLYAVV